MRRLLAALLVSAAPLAAQDPDDPRRVPTAPRLEFRAAVPTSDWPAGELGAALSLRAGWYARLGVGVLAGAAQDDGATIGSVRAEGAVRFHLDPFNEGRGCGVGVRGICRGYYAGLGLSHRVRGAGLGAEPPVLVVLLGLESSADRPSVWATEIAVGGGVRVGLSWRRRRTDGFR